MDSIVSRACLQICRIVTFRSTKTPFWHTSLFTTRRWLHSGQHPIHSSSTNMYSPAQSRPRIEYITKIPNILCITKCFVHQYVFTVLEQTQNRVHSKYKTYYVSQNVLCTNMYSPAQSGIEQPNAKETELLISISFKVLEFSGFSLALAYFLSHFLLMPHFKRNWSLSDWQSATCCDSL